MFHRAIDLKLNYTKYYIDFYTRFKRANILPSVPTVNLQISLSVVILLGALLTVLLVTFAV